MKKALTLIGLLLAGGWAMGQLRITEICPRPTEADPNGKTSGWIELTNTSETESVNLSDYALIRFNRGNKDSSKKRLALLSQVVAPGERVVVYTSEAYANFKDIGGSGKVELFGELMVYPNKVNPKKYPTVRLHKGSEIVDTFEVPVDLADGKSFAPGSLATGALTTVTREVVGSSGGYRYRAETDGAEEAWQTGGTGSLGIFLAEDPTAAKGALEVTLTPDSDAFTEGEVSDGSMTRTAWDLSSNTGKNTGLTAPAKTLASALEAYTVAFWFKAQKTGGTGDQSARILFDYRPSKDTDDYSGVVVVLTGEGQLEVQPRTADKIPVTFYSDTEADYGDDTWHHVALSIGRKQGDRLRLWADGEKCIDTTLTFDIPLRTDVPLCFGCAYNSTAWGLFNGALADIAIYPRALISADGEAQTTLTLEALCPVAAEQPFSADAGDTLTLSATVSGGTVAATLDGTAVALGEALTLTAGDHTLAWRLTPEEAALTATIDLSAQLTHQTKALTRVILPNPTPGAENDLTGAVSYGPNIGPAVGSGSKGTGVTAASPAAPGVDYTVTYEIHPLSEEPDNAITAVTLLYRADFGEIKRTAMTNTSGNLWQGTIPAADLPAEGHLLRYAAQIVDADGGTWRSPSFCNPDDGYEWFGTLVKGETATDETLQTFHLFADSTALANMDKQYDAISGSLPLGARVGVFDEQSNTYYDNVRIDLRGNTSAGFNKKSHGLRFSKCQPLTCTNPFDGEVIKEIRKTSFIAEYCDPTYIRQALSFWLLRQAGNLTPFDYPVRLQLNGEFYQLAFHSNRFTDELIEDYYGFGEADGSVGYGYKNVGPFTSGNAATAIEKKTPDDGNEKDLSVLQAFTATLPTATVTEATQAQATRRVVEAFDLPAWVNYLAAARVTQECDDIWANLSAYYDNLHTDTWMPLAYDLNLSFGQWYYNDDPATGRIGLRVTDDGFKSHPLYGGYKIRAHRKNGTEVGAANQALEALFQNPKFRRLYLRRLRTLMDGYLKAPDTAQEATPLWQQALRYKAAIAHLEELDRTKWNYATQATGTAIWVWPRALSLDEGFTDLWEYYFVPRRKHLYETHALGSTTRPEGYGAECAAGIPAAQSAIADLAPNFAFANAHSTDGSEAGFAAAEGVLTITNANAEAVDMSGWVLSGAVVWTLPAGTVVDANDSLTIVADRKAYVAGLSAEAKAAAPVILGNAPFSTAALDLTLTDADGTSVCAVSWAPPTAEKQFLRVVEVYANTADAGGDGAEYILLKNISESETLSLANIRLTSQKRGSSPKVDITLPAGTLAPGATCRLEKADFASAGWEKITNGKVDMFLYDSVGALIQSIGFTSSGAADGGGASLVTEKTDTTLVDVDWTPSFELPSAEGTTAAAVTAAIAETPAIGSWLAGLDTEGQNALAAFTGSAEDLTTCYLVDLPPQAAPEVESRHRHHLRRRRQPLHQGRAGGCG